MSTTSDLGNLDEVPKTAEEPHEHRTRNTFSSEPRLRRFASWSAVLGAIGAASYFAIFMAIQTLKPSDPNSSWIITQFKQNFAATLGIPLSALTAFCVVTLLRATTGPIEIEMKGLKFSGASGPIIFWILCFLVIVIGVKLLWGLG